MDKEAHVMNSPESRQSTLIDTMRFPLIVMVVFVHSAGVFSSPTIDLSFEAWNVLHFFSELVSRHLCSVGTCWFFVFAGYLFFINWNGDGNTVDWKWYAEKWKKRLNSLLVPYLVWNLLAVLATVLKVRLLPVLGVAQSGEEMAAVYAGPMYWFINGPADFPLWFMRDLIVLSLLTPLMQLVFRKLPWISLVLLTVLYLVCHKSLVLFSMRGFYFFSMGAWMGLRRGNFLDICKKVKIPAAVLCVVLSVVATLRTGYTDHTFWLMLFHPFGMITFMNICDRLIDSDRRRERLQRLSASVFFIYSAHEIYILQWSKGAFVRILGEGLAATWIKFLFVPVVTLIACLVLYHILDRIIPGALSFACGGRSKTVHHTGCRRKE